MRPIISWFARNGVAATLLMVLIIVGGLLTIPQIRQEIFPDIDTGTISVTVIYPGATPEEIEESICVRIEEAIQGVQDVKHINSVAAEGAGTVTVELIEGADESGALDEVKSRVDGIDTFPEEAEQPVIQDVVLRRQVINVAVSGAADERTLKRLGEQVRDEIAALPGITQVDLVNARPYEVAIEVSEADLRRYGLSFDVVGRAVRQASLDLPGGSIKTSGGEILLRAKGQAYRGPDFEDLVLITRADGSRIHLGDVANVVDGFTETDQYARFDGHPAVNILVYRVGDQGALAVAEAVKDYVAEAQPRMPEGISLTTWQDFSRLLRGRMNLLVRNGATGLLLVFIVLALFLRFRLAFWVAMGIPISFLGAFLLMPTLDVSINLISLFAFIVVLGIVVDDAIVVGENVYRVQRSGVKGLRGAIEGTAEVSTPVIFAVLTTVAAFFPMLDVPGTRGQVFRVIPLIVIPTLVFSLIESHLVLPFHLSHEDKPHKRSPLWAINQGWRNFQEGFASRLERFVDRAYGPWLTKVLRWRYVTVAVFVGLLIVTVGMIRGGRVRFIFFPKVEADNVVVALTMPQGAPVAATAAGVLQLETAALQLKDDLDAERDGKGVSAFQHITSSVGEQPSRQARAASGPGGRQVSFAGSHLGEVSIELAPSEDRTLASPEIANRWRELAGPIPDAVEVAFTSSLFQGGEPVNIQLAGRDVDRLRLAAEAVKERVATFDGVFDITDTYRAGKQEIKLRIKPSAEALGLTLSDLARQVRQGFYGEEAQRIQRGRDEVKVMIRYPEEERRSIGDLENMRVRTPDGREVPFSAVAEAEYGRAYSSIRRTDRMRTVNVTADVDPTRGDVNAIAAELKASVMPDILSHHPGVTYSFEGQQSEQRETMGGLARGFVLALIAIYALMAIPFRSYVQPLIVMTAIPFGFVGAVWGHVLMGKDLSLMSGFGIVALSGVVVNDSLVLVDFVNRRRREGMPLLDAVRAAGKARFRPIVLTSLTTFAGLSPMLLERSLQAQFLIPMAISLAFGVMFATFITLIFVPSSYMILEDVRSLHFRLFGREHAPVPQEASEASG